MCFGVDAVLALRQWMWRMEGCYSSREGNQEGRVMRLMARDETMGPDIYGVATWNL